MPTECRAVSPTTGSFSHTPFSAAASSPAQVTRTGSRARLPSREAQVPLLGSQLPFMGESILASLVPGRYLEEARKSESIGVGV